MSVDDHGLEAIRKSAEEITPGDKSEYRLKVNVVAGSTSGTEYTEGDTDASISGGVVMWEDTSDTIVATSAGKPLPVNVVSGGTSGTQYTEGDTDATITGTAIMWEDAANTLATVSGANPLPIKISDGTDVADVLDLANSNPLVTALVDANGDQITSFGGGVQYTEGDTDASITGNAILWESSANTLVSTSATNPFPVQGPVADGAASTANPILVGGLDSSNNIQSLQTAPDGDLITHLHSDSVAFSDGVSNTLRIPVNESDFGFMAFPSIPYNFNGTTWDRVKGDATNGLLVNLGSNNDVSVSNGSGGSAVNIQDGGNSITVDNSTLSVVGGGTEATALRVTIANDSTGVVSIDDNGGSITVDGTVAATQSGSWSVSLTDGVDTADILDLTNSNPLTVAIVDASGDQITSFGGGTQYAEGDTSATITGTAIMFESNTGTNTLSVVNNSTPLPIADAGGSLTVDNSTLSVVGGGVEATALRVTIATDSTGVLSIDDNGGSLTIDNAALSVTGGGVEASALRVTIANDSTGVLSIDDNGGSITVDGTVAATQSGTWILGANSGVDIGDVTINNASGASAVNIQDGGNTITVDGTVAVSSITTSITPGTGSTNLGKAEDAAHASGHVGVMALAVRNDTAATSFSGTDADYTPIGSDAQGRIHTRNWAQQSSGTTLTALNTTFTSTTEVESGDITTTGYRFMDVVFTIVSAGSPGLMTVRAISRHSSTSFKMRNGWPGTWYYSDASVTTSQNIWLTNIPVSKTGTMRISVQCNGVDGAGNNYTISNATAYLGT